MKGASRCLNKIIITSGTEDPVGRLQSLFPQQLEYDWYLGPGEELAEFCHRSPPAWQVDGGDPWYHQLRPEDSAGSESSATLQGLWNKHAYTSLQLDL